MPQPTPGQLHVDRYLTNLSVGYVQEQSAFVADKVFPIVPVLKASDKYAIYPKGYFYRDEMTVRPLGGEPPTVGYDVESGTYVAEEWALAHNIDDRVRSNADQPLDPDRAAMRLLTTQAMIHRDREWAEGYFKTGVWGTDLVGAASEPEAGEFLQFDQSGSNPIRLIDEKREALRGATGYRPNTLVLGADAFIGLKNNEVVLDRIKYTQKALVTEDLLASLLEIDKVVVAGSVQNTGLEGAEESVDFILGKKDALLVYSAPSPGIEVPSGGYIFAWTGLIPQLTNAFGGVIERTRKEAAHSDHIQIRAAYDMKAVSTDLGVFLSEAVS